MSGNNVIMALAKVMIAEAWVDGRVSNEEINCLKDLLFHMPSMTASDWDQLDIYIETPVGPAERDRLVEELRLSLKTKEDRNNALGAINMLANADGSLTPDEAKAVDEIREIIQGSGAGLSGRLGKLMGGSMNRRAQSMADAPNRERYLEDYTRNKIYYSVSRRLELEGTKVDIPETELRRLSLAGGLMARVAFVDTDIQQVEKDAMLQAIRRYWGTSEVGSALVVEIAASEIGKGMDYYRLTREFFEATTEDERMRFLAVLFAVAASDGKVSNTELEDIRTISMGLKLTHQQFINAKLTIPEEQRST